MRCWPPRPPGPQTYMTYHDLNIFGWMTTWIASCLSDILLWNLLTRICTLGWPMFDQSLQQRPPVQAGSKPFSIIHSPINCFLWQPGEEFCLQGEFQRRKHSTHFHFHHGKRQLRNSKSGLKVYLHPQVTHLALFGCASICWIHGGDLVNCKLSP